MPAENELKKIWESIGYRNGGSLQLNVPHRLKWYVSYVNELQKAIVIKSSIAPHNMQSSKSIEARIVHRDDGAYNILLILTERRQEDVFISMCANLIDYSSDAENEANALAEVASRYQQWQRLMEHKNSSLLSIERQKGLIGELLYLKQMLENGMPAKEAVEGWVGPEGADQDFVYKKIWHEIKSTGLSSDSVKISSVEQLGNADETGELIVQRIDKCAPESSGAFSLNDLVCSIENIINEDEVAFQKFDGKLNCAGYISMPEYSRVKFKYFEQEAYEVNASFPRISRLALGQISTAIVNCTYIINLPAIQEWKKD